MPRIWGNPSRNPNFAARYPSYTVVDMRWGTGQFDGAGATKELFLAQVHDLGHLA